MQRKTFTRLLISTLATAGLSAPVLAQAPVEISFFYPVAVGGPITKTIDGYAADFARDNPGIKVNPIYAGTYQETIVKALTAHKSGQPPVTSVLLSTDMFTLIDEDAIEPVARGYGYTPEFFQLGQHNFTTHFNQPTVFLDSLPHVNGEPSFEGSDAPGIALRRSAFGQTFGIPREGMAGGLMLLLLAQAGKQFQRVVGTHQCGQQRQGAI